MKLAINAVSAKKGGAVTYLQNVLPELQANLGSGSRIVVWRAPAITADDQWPAGIEFRENAVASGVNGVAIGSNPARRLWFDQVALPRIVRAERFDALFSSANFGPIVPLGHHVLLVRNAAYFDRVLLGRMTSARVRAFFAAQRWLTLACMRTADVVLFPSRAMLELVACFAQGSRPNWVVAPYGTRHEAFRRRAPVVPMPAKARVELLNVSLYADQKNFGTLLRAMTLLNERDPARYHLRLTAGFRRDSHASSSFFPNFAAEQAAFTTLGAAGLADDADWRQYGSLPALYHAADIFVFPSYSESFGHPLLEAMAAGLPIVAADVPINREMCGAAAEYFSPFDAEACAAAVRRVAGSASVAQGLRLAGAARVAEFSWARHARTLADALSSK